MLSPISVVSVSALAKFSSDCIAVTVVLTKRRLV